MSRFSRRDRGLVLLLGVLLAAASPPPAKAVKYFYDGQLKAKGVTGRINSVTEFAYEWDGNRTERVFTTESLRPRLVDSSLTVDIQGDVQRVYFFWGDGHRDVWVNQSPDRRRSTHSFLHNYLWNGYFLCQIYVISQDGTTRQYNAEITIAGL